MTMLSQTLRPRIQLALLALLLVSVLLTPLCAMAAEREGTVLFFPFADLKPMLSHPVLPALPSRSALFPSRAWQEQYNAVEQDGPLERNARWGNGLGFDGCAYPGSRRSLWGF